MKVKEQSIYHSWYLSPPDFDPGSAVWEADGLPNVPSPPIELVFYIRPGHTTFFLGGGADQDIARGPNACQNIVMCSFNCFENCFHKTVFRFQKSATLDIKIGSQRNWYCNLYGINLKKIKFLTLLLRLKGSSVNYVPPLERRGLFFVLCQGKSLRA